MENDRSVDLYWERSESALDETLRKYGAYCFGIAYRILRSREDAEECVNDALRKTWETVPPNRPQHFGAYVGTIVRTLAIDRYSVQSAEKRGGGQMEPVLHELAECIPDNEISGDAETEESIIARLALQEMLGRFLQTLPEETRRLFLGRYWYMYEIKELARAYGMGESKVKMSLLRTRKKLKDFLEGERETFS